MNADSSSSPAPATTVTVTDSNGQSIGGGDTGTCTGNGSSYRISTFDNPAGKLFALGLVGAFVKNSDAKYYYCDGGNWIVAADVEIKNKPTAEQQTTLKKAAQTAHGALGCRVVTLP